MDSLLFESSIEPMHNTVGLRLCHECEAWSNTAALDLILESIRALLCVVVHPKRQPPGNIGTERSSSGAMSVPTNL